MKRPVHLLLPAALAAALPALSGCSTVVHWNRPSGLSVQSTPSGAAIFVDGVAKGRTPARVAVDGEAGDHVVRIVAEGREPVERTVRKGMDPWVWGNAPLAVFPVVAAAGVGIDAVGGEWYRLDPSALDVTLPAGAAPAQKPAVAPKPAAAQKPATKPVAKPAPPAQPAAQAATPAAKPSSPAAPAAKPAVSSETAARPSAPTPPEPSAAASASAPAPSPAPAAKPLSADETDALLKQLLEND